MTTTRGEASSINWIKATGMVMMMMAVVAAVELHTGEILQFSSPPSQDIIKLNLLGSRLDGSSKATLLIIAQQSRRAN